MIIAIDLFAPFPPAPSPVDGGGGNLSANLQHIACAQPVLPSWALFAFAFLPPLFPSFFSFLESLHPRTLHIWSACLSVSYIGILKFTLIDAYARLPVRWEQRKKRRHKLATGQLFGVCGQITHGKVAYHTLLLYHLSTANDCSVLTNAAVFVSLRLRVRH